MKHTSLGCLLAWIVLAGWGISPASAAPALDTVNVDLDPLIDAASHSQVQFAVNIPHPVSSSRQGTWSGRGSTRTWVYSTRVPTAISISFHAPTVVLPPSAVLTVSTPQASFHYTARQVNRGGLWGRPMAGDTLNFTLTVSASEASRVRLQIDSFQAGYRSLGGNVPDHPHYTALRRAAAAAGTACTENYECYATDATQGPSHATVAVLVSDLYQCTGTLLNSTSGAGTPYVLTARHCESGELGGGNPDAAAAVSVIWDAITPCGTALGSIYTASSVSQTGATTVLEQQDAWLIKLDSQPVASDAYFAGWDASGTPITGGYTIEDAQGGTQQYVGWNGTDLLEQLPAATLGIGYDSTFWGVVNGVGNIGAGASGGALFSPDDRVVGSASLAALVNGPNSLGVCPAIPPAAPSAQSATALFTALSGVFASTADRTSSTGAKTLQSFLDPAGTGALTTDGLATSPVTLTASETNANTGDLITLSWDVPGAQSCTALGGSTGDGWTGSLPASGSQQVGNSSGGTVTYSLGCQLDTGQIGSGNATVVWDYIPPTVSVMAPTLPVMLGSQWSVEWSSNVEPCVATGGVAGDGWAGPQPSNGALTFSITNVGLTTYTLTCGSAPRSATSSAGIYSVLPAITLTASSSQIRAGAGFTLSWFGSGAGGACTPSGGSSTDLWASTVGLVSNGRTSITETVPGTYTYTLTCTGGGQSASSSATVVVSDAAPAASLTPIFAQQQTYPSTGTAGAAYDLLWSANVDSCTILYTPNQAGAQQAWTVSGSPGGAFSDAETVPGAVTYTLQCGNVAATAMINWVTTPTPTPNALALTTPNWAAGVAYPISWSAGAGPCVASGGGAEDGWAGSKAQSGTQSLTESQPGTYVFSLTCGSGSAATTGEVVAVVPLPFIQMLAQPSGGLASEATTSIVWQSTVGPCTYVDGSSGNRGVAVPPSGSATPDPATSGLYVFTLTCGSGTQTLSTATVAQVNAPVPTTLTASATSTPVFTPVTLTWNGPPGSYCEATGGDGTLPWAGGLPGSSGSLIVTSRSPGTLTYGITCDTSRAQVSVVYTATPSGDAVAPTPAVTLSASPSSVAQGQSVSLVWSSQNASACTASGGEPGDGWAGAQALAGTLSVTETQTGTVSYSITCTGAPPAATAVTKVVVSAAQSASSSSSSHGGGGALDLTCLAVLGLALGLRFAPIARQGRC